MSSRRYEKIASKGLFTHPRIKLVEDAIFLPNGTKSSYLLYENLHDGVSVIIVREDGKILLNHEYSYPSDAFEYQIPGGAVDKGELPINAAKREIKEEAGIVANNIEQLGSVLYDHRRSKALNYFFIAKDISVSEFDQEAEELIDHFWFTEQQINEMIVAGKILHYGTLSAWAYYLARKTIG